jgi:hypothetical protein
MLQETSGQRRSARYPDGVNAREVRRLDALHGRLRTLAAELARVGFLSRGSLVASYTTCGKESCRCARDADQRHGPYWQWSRAVRGRTVTRRLSAGQAALYRQWIANQRSLDRIVGQMQEVSRRAGEILLREEERGGSSPTRTTHSAGSR